MKFVLAPDSFKESMTSKQACEAMERGIKKIFKDAQCIQVPMADGGEGTVEALVCATGGTLHQITVTDPLGNSIKSDFGVLGNGKTAVIEMAKASGIQLVKREDRNPLITTTYGTGELIKAALDQGSKHIVIGIGGSATNDGGAGMVQALGGKLLDEQGNQIGFGGGELSKIKTIDLTGLDARLKEVVIEVACDVTNPLIGKTGASAIFGPQKGATPEMVAHLDANLTHYANVIKMATGKEIAQVEGAGAAGGLGGALLAFLNAKLERGIELVIKHTELANKVQGADFVFTGEGAIDEQTKFGKTPMGVAQVSKKHGAKVIVFAGKIGQGTENLYPVGIDAIFGILTGVTTLDEALALGEKNIEIASENVARLIQIGLQK